jgi:hypothetical protein
MTGRRPRTDELTIMAVLAHVGLDLIQRTRTKRVLHVPTSL